MVGEGVVKWALPVLLTKFVASEAFGFVEVVRIVAIVFDVGFIFCAVENVVTGRFVVE